MTKNRYHAFTWLTGVALFEARLTDETFPRHAHEGFAIGAIARGVGGYFHRGAHQILPSGSLSLMNPEEAHDGRAHSRALSYTMLYATEKAAQAQLDIAGVSGFRAVAPPDPGATIGQALGRLAAAVNAPKTASWRLCVEERLIGVLGLAFATHGGATLRAPGREPAAIARVRAAICAGVASGDDLSLRALAEIADLHPSYLVRSFSKTVGLTPHAYTLYRRVLRARDALLAGRLGAEAALEAGFYDQSHMIRHFHRHLGVTPSAIERHHPPT